MVRPACRAGAGLARPSAARADRPVPHRRYRRVRCVRPEGVTRCQPAGVLIYPAELRFPATPPVPQELTYQIVCHTDRCVCQVFLPTAGSGRARQSGPHEAWHGARLRRHGRMTARAMRYGPGCRRRGAGLGRLSLDTAGAGNLPRLYSPCQPNHDPGPDKALVRAGRDPGRAGHGACWCLSPPQAGQIVRSGAGRWQNMPERRGRHGNPSSPRPSWTGSDDLPLLDGILLPINRPRGQSGHYRGTAVP